MVRRVVQNLLTSGFAGCVLPVQRSGGEVEGLHIYRSLDELPEPPDLAVLAVGAARCVGLAKALGQLGCRTLVILSDGFAETGVKSQEHLQDQLRDVCAESGMELIGPNSIGFANFTNNFRCLGSPLSQAIRVGGVSIVSQSGALLTAMVEACVSEGLGLDIALSIGNGAGLGIPQALAAVASRPTTTTICAYVETFGPKSDAIVNALTSIQAMGKSLVTIKAGYSELGRRLALSHTASASGPQLHSDAMLVRYGALPVSDIEDMVRAATVLSAQDGKHRAFRYAVVSGSGGGSALAADLCERHKVSLAEFSGHTAERIRQMISDSGFPGNPLDSTAFGKAGALDLDGLYDAVFADNQVDAVIQVWAISWPDAGADRAFHHGLLESMARCSDRYGKPLFVCSVYEQPLPDWSSTFVQRHNGVRLVNGLGRLLSMIGAVGAGTGSMPSIPGRSLATRGSTGTVAANDLILSEGEARELLLAAGVPIVPGTRCETVGAAVTCLQNVGAPVVVKVDVHGLNHKSALGGVRLAICDPAALADACQQMFSTFEQLTNFRDRWLGFLVEKQVFGTEFVAAIADVPPYGKTLTIGLGAELSESSICRASCLLPVSETDVDYLVRRAGLTDYFARAGGPTYAGFRDWLILFARACDSGPLRLLDTVEVNPLVVTHSGESLAADVLAISNPGDRTALA